MQQGSIKGMEHAVTSDHQYKITYDNSTKRIFRWQARLVPADHELPFVGDNSWLFTLDDGWAFTLDGARRKALKAIASHETRKVWPDEFITIPALPVVE